MSENKENESVEEQVTEKARSKIFFFVILAGIFFTLIVSLLAIHFTSLRYKTAVDPIGLAIYKTKEMAASNDVERAYLHISESERLVKEIKTASHEGHSTANMKPHEKMVRHNEEATKYMLAAEANGTNLREVKLIKRLCDTLGEQYALITNTNVSDIPDASKLNTRVNKGEELQVVFGQIQAQLQKAMNW